MKKSMSKKALPPWIPRLMIVVALVVIVVTYLVTERRGKPGPRDLAAIQKFVNEGGVPPFISRPRLEQLGIKFPPNYEELVKQRQARTGTTGPAGRGLMRPGR